jgi:N utilization substance protein A
VSDFQLSLAIGKEGQNARLAARLTGWRIDIKSETQLAEEEAGYADQEWAEGEWVEDEGGELVWKPAEGGEAMSAKEWSHQAEETGEVTAPAEAAATPEVAPEAEVTPEAGVAVEVEVTEVAGVTEEAEA